MELTEFIRLLRRGWMLLLTATLLGLLAGSVSSLLSTKTYDSTTSLYVSVQTPGDNSAVDLSQGSSAAQAKVRSYVQIVSSSDVLDPVIKELRLSESSTALAGRVSALSKPNTVNIEITVSDTDPVRAAALADAVAKSFSSVVAEKLEAPTVGSTSPVRITTFQKAVVPTAPSSPNVPVNVALGLFCGLLAGLAATLLRHTLDTRIHGANDIAPITATPVIGGIGFDPEAAKHPLIVHVDPRSPRAESFRALRTNLNFIDPGATRRSYVVTSAMPSEGKSTTTANLAIALAESGASVALVDADLRRPRTAEIMGIEGAIGLTDVLIGEIEMSDAVQPWGSRGNLVVLPAGRVPPNPSELLGSRAMTAALDDLSAQYDFVLIDAPPLLPVTDAAVLSKIVSGTLLVVSATSSKRGQLREAVASLEHIGSRALGIIMTKLPTKGPNGYGYATYTDYYGRAPEKTVPAGAMGRRALRNARS